MAKDWRRQDLTRIEEALRRAAEVLQGYTSGRVTARLKAGGDPVTEADLEVDTLLRELLPRDGEGWLSEETADDPSRLSCSRVWVVDPLDGTREFVQGIPEWCVSVGLVEEGRAVAGGILNPVAGVEVLGSLETGVTLNRQPARVRPVGSLAGEMVLASRSELRRGEWDLFRDEPFEVSAMGSVAYKLARVASGLAAATWTPVPKNEWDVAAGVALVRAAGGAVETPSGEEPAFNRRRPLLDGLVAAPAGAMAQARELLGRQRETLRQGSRASSSKAPQVDDDAEGA